jgi:hypothetical protein
MTSSRLFTHNHNHNHINAGRGERGHGANIEGEGGIMRVQLVSVLFRNDVTNL